MSTAQNINGLLLANVFRVCVKTKCASKCLIYGGELSFCTTRH